MKMDFKKRQFTVIIDILMISFITFMVGYIWYIARHYQEPNLLSSLTCSDMSDGWERILEDGSRVPVQLNADYYVKANEKLVIERTLPDTVLDNYYIAFRAKRQEVRVYINDELRFEFSHQSGYADIGKIVSRYLFVNLRREDSGGTVRIEGMAYSDGNRKLTMVYYGEKAGVIAEYLKQQGGAISIAITFLVVGILSVLLGYALRIATQNELRTDYIGWAMFIISVWDFSQSDFRDFFFNNITMMSLTATLALLIISIPLALYFNWVQRGRYKRVYYPLMVIFSANVVILTLLAILNVLPYSKALVPAFVELFGLAALFWVLAFIDYKRGKFSKEYRAIIVGTIFVAAGGAGQTVMFYTPKESETGTFLCLGMLGLTVSAFAFALTYIFKMNSDKKAAIMTAESKTQFLATMSHEIRTPINAVLGMNEAIRRETTEENIRNYADDVDTAGNLLLTLVNDILDLTKLESGKMTLIDAPFRVLDVVDFSLEMIEGKALDKGLKLETVIDKNIPGELYGDEVRVKQIIINILNNAVKYTERGRITFKVEAKPLQDSKVLLCVSVSDTGRGIKQEDLGKLFNAFTRVDEIKNSKIEGTGLGLVIVSRLLKLMGGDIDVESTYGSGSTFTIRFPARISDATPIGEYSATGGSGKREHKAVECFKASGVNVLVVDDVDMNLRVFNAVMKDSEMVIETAIDGDSSIEKTLVKKYDIIFMDHMMPGKDGIETLKEIRGNAGNPNASTPMVVMTANAMEGAKEEYFKQGFDDYVSKPFKMADIERVVTGLVLSKR